MRLCAVMVLGLLSQCFYASVKELFQDAAQEPRSLPGMIGSLQSYGDDPTRFHPHLHSLVTDGLVSSRGSFVPVPCPHPVRIMELSRHKLVEADPLVCPRCCGPLKIVSLIGDGAVIEKILRHLKLWDRPERSPPAAPARSMHYDPDIPGLEQAGPA